MKSFNKTVLLVIVIIAGLFIAANVFISKIFSTDQGRPYRVEAGRAAYEIENYGFDSIDLSKYSYIKEIKEYGLSDSSLYDTEYDYCIKKINGRLYRIDYQSDCSKMYRKTVILTNMILAAMTVMITVVLLFIRNKILMPFNKLTDVPYELSKGNLTAPLSESRTRFFGKFVWGVNLLREKMEKQKQSELQLQKDKKTLLLSISHDIKTPLSAIKLYSKSLSKGLYKDKQKQTEVAESINAKADEIEDFITQLIRAAGEDFLDFEISDGEFYMSELINKIESFYSQKLSLINTEFICDEYGDSLLNGDFDRSVEVLQNIMENAIKYGDGHIIKISFSEEENCRLITVQNSGCTLSDNEILHIFDSFWRGSNSESKSGSGLGLYICRQLMNAMNGDIFAHMSECMMNITVVFPMA